MKLVLAGGETFTGRSFGAERAVRGEVVFHTGLVGYVEALTDPSYRGQILVLTYPLQGNYGVPDGPFESDRIQVQGLAAAHYTPVPSHHAAVRSLGDWLRAEGVPAICGVDTRALVHRLRNHGTMPGALLFEDRDAHDTAAAVDMTTVVQQVEPATFTEHLGSGPRILVIDTGGKESIVRALRSRDAHVLRAPASAPWEQKLDQVDGVVLTNGPGDPQALRPLVERLRAVLAANLPTFGVCLGHQLLALCAGATTYKLPYGHRSHNQPVQDLSTGRAYVTSQNHGYAVHSESLPADWALWFSNLNDGTCEGIRHRTKPFSSVQFHPEAAGGPRDTAPLFDEFLHTVNACKRVCR